jgi:transcriptional regulator with XRE-family HTH domain
MPTRAKSRQPFAHRLVQVRKAKGISQYDLADMTGLSQRVIAHYETVIRNPNPDVVVKLAKALKVSSDELMGLAPLKEKEPPLKNRRLLRKLKVLDQFSVEDQKKIIGHIDDISTKYKTKSEDS